MAGRCECQRPCNCCTTGTPTVAVAGSGSAGQCFQPSVRFSADPSNAARAGTDGGVFVDGSFCLVGDDGPILPDGDGCYVLPAGGLAVQNQRVDEALVVNPVVVAATTVYDSPVSTTVSLVNPSPARPLAVQVHLQAYIDATVDVSGGQARIEHRMNGGAWVPHRDRELARSTAPTRAGQELTAIVLDFVAPLATIDIEVRVTVTAGATAVTLEGAEASITLVGVAS